MRRVVELAGIVLLLFGGVVWLGESAAAQTTRVCGVGNPAFVQGTGGGRNGTNTVVATGEPRGPGDPGFVSLGQGGSLTIELAAPGASADGTPNSDLFIYESGTVAEFVTVEISVDGSTFVTIGVSGSQASGIDLDAAGIAPGTNYLFVRVTDDPNSGPGGPDTGGADIDAVCGSNTGNASPEAVDDSETFAVGDAYTTNVFANDSDPDGDDLEIESFTQPADGTVVIADDGTATFTPTDPDFEGTVAFTYTIIDGQGGRATAIVTFQIGEPDDAEDPVVVGPIVETEPNEPVSGDLNDNIVDPQGDPLEFAVVTPPANGTLELDPDGAFTYTPDDDFTGEDPFEVEATDPDGNSIVATITAVVEPPGPGVPIVVDPVIETDPGEPISGNLNDLVVDPEGDPLQFAVVTPPANGTLELEPDGTFVYEPDENFVGEDRFEVIATDPDGNSIVAGISIVVGDSCAIDDDVETGAVDEPPTAGTPIVAQPCVGQPGPEGQDPDQAPQPGEPSDPPGGDGADGGGGSGNGGSDGGSGSGGPGGSADPGSGEAGVVGLPNTGAGTSTTGQPLLVLLLGTLSIAMVAGLALRRR